MKFLLIATFAIVLVLNSIQGRPWLENCEGKAADVVFILDTSSSVSPYDFQMHVRPFVRDVVRMFDVGPSVSQTRVGVVTFSDEYNPQIDLGMYLRRQELDNAISNIVQSGGSTFTNKALQHVAYDMFHPGNGARAEALPVIILLTDGKSTFPTVTKTEAQAARAKGIQIFAIGVGDDVDEQELRSVASDPDSLFKFHVKDFRALHGIQQLLALRACEVVSASTTPAVTTTERPVADVDPAEYCGGKPADVYFLLDVSSSVWIKNFNTKVLPFVRDMVSVFDIGADKTRVGIVKFSDEISPVISLDQYTSRDQLMAALNPNHVRYTGGQTYTSSALTYVRDVGFGPKLARPGIAQVMIVITDGVSYDPERTAAAAKEAKRRGIYMFAVGVGSAVDYQELHDISSDPDQRFVFNVTDFNALSSIRNILAIRTCRVTPTLPPPSDLFRCDIDFSDVYFIFESFSKTSEVRKIFRSSVVDLVQNKLSKTKDVRMSAITDPCVGEEDIPFTSLIDFKLRIGSIPISPKTKLFELLKKFKIEALSPREVSRQTRRNVGIVFLDEATKDLHKVVMEARRAQSMGIELFVVAVGNIPSRTVDMIASAPVNDHVLMIDSYNNMHILDDRLGRMIC